jgi:iron complex outermembrane receptor protein
MCRGRTATRRAASTWPGHAGLTGVTPNFDTEFPRESVESYELGVKSELADRTVRLNASLFDQQYTNFQLNTYTGLQFVVSTVRHLESKGAESIPTGRRRCRA